MEKDIALVIVDMQNDYCHEKGVFPVRSGASVDSIKNTYAYFQNLIQEFRKLKLPIVWIKTHHYPERLGILATKRPFLLQEGLRKGTWGAEVVEELKVYPDDIIIEKHRFSGFFNTKLNDILTDLGITRLVIGGVVTEHCVESTVRDAFFNNYEAIVSSNCVASYDQEAHEASLRAMASVYGMVQDHEQILQLLSKYEEAQLA